jgi:P27 family predicted phage terminase small subunit
MRGARPQLQEIDGGLLKAPPPPDTLPPGMTETWVKIAADLQGRGLLFTSMLEILETYIGAIWLAREARKAIIADGLIVRAKDGQGKPNPASAMLKSANETVARLGAELGLTPSARSRKSITPPNEGGADEWSDMDL